MFPCPPPPLPPRANQHCRHYGYENTGLAGWRAGNKGGPTCAVGVDNRTEPGAALPCMPPDMSAKRPACARREEWTEDERKAWIERRNHSIERAVVVMMAIPGSADSKKRDRWGETGSLSCPACGTGTVRWSRARVNGHLWAACSTPNCFAVQQ